MLSWRLAVLLLAGGTYAGLSHWMMLFHAAEPWAFVVLLGPMWVMVVGLGSSRFGAAGVVVALIAGAVALALVSRGEADPNRLYMLQHVGINVVLGVWFGASLRAGRTSLIGELAARVHPMTSAMWAYSANVTRMWAGYFFLMAMVSFGVYVTLRFDAWSLLANVLAPVCVVALFLGEHFMRYRLHPEFERSRLVDVVRAFRAAPPQSALRR